MNGTWFNSDTQTITDQMQQTIQMLGQRQMSNGGFSYWPETGARESDDFASVYAMHFLTRNEIITTNYLTNLQLTLDKIQPKQWHQDITSVG